MGFADKLQTTLPDNIDNESKEEEKRKQTITALSVDFRNSVKAKGDANKSVEEVIWGMSIKDINDIFFDDYVPSAPGNSYHGIIEEFLSETENYIEALDPIVDGYLSIVSDLQKQVQKLLLDGLTKEEDAQNRTSTATYLDARLTSIAERTKLIVSVHKDVDQLQGQLLETKESVADLSNVVKSISKESNEITPNLISLLGIFSSIIVVILTLITTSSTWLLNANEISVIIAFVVPAGIIILAICALTALVRSLVGGQAKRNDDSSTNEKHGIRVFFQNWAVWIVVATVTIVFLVGTVQFCQQEHSDDVHYIVKYAPTSQSEHEDENSEAQLTTENADAQLFILQEIVLPTGEIYPQKIYCSENDIHEDGFVYYCLLHQVFE